MFWFGRLVQFFLCPDKLGLILFLAAIVIYRRGNRVWAFRSAFVGALLMVVPGIPIVSWKLLQDIESAYPVRVSRDYPTADAIVVLGGTVARVLPPRLEPEETGGSRLLQAAKLYKLNKAKWVLVSGGDPYTGSDGRNRNQAIDMRDVLVAMGVPESAILVQGASRNTEEDILFSARMLQEQNLKSALLVTNAFHMKRAMTLTAGTGTQWYPVPTGHEASETDLTFASYWPTWGHVNSTNRSIKEIVGLQYARYRVSRRTASVPLESSFK